ncbi:MAG: tryptophanase [Candidatus Saganbacteria bacterium]|nr:tryptophanase [Candidatus Saganbacteria bacterium]
MAKVGAPKPVDLSAAQARLAALLARMQKEVVTPAELHRALKEAGVEADRAQGIQTLTAADRVPRYTIKMVQATGQSTLEERYAELVRTGFNVFCVRAGTILLDMLTDSGTGAQSDAQWAAMMLADERYAHSVTYEEFIPIAQRIFGKEFILPVHQGRAAERITFPVLLRALVAARKTEGKEVACLGNTYFDTTRALITAEEAVVIDSPCAAAKNTQDYDPFKGNADIDHMRAMIEKYGPANIGFVMMTVVNNCIGGQPVSMENLRAAHALAKEYKLLFLLDAARIFENAYFIQQREPGYQGKSISEIVGEMTKLADVILMSAKKDAIANMGGIIATNNHELYDLFLTLCIAGEGHYSYGGMSGRDLAALTVGLQEGQDQEYLRARINQVAELGNGFRRLGIPTQWPTGSNGVFVDARQFLDHVHELFFPAQRLCAEIYHRYGIRPVEIGLSLHGRDKKGIKVLPGLDLVRFTVPRRTFTGDHIAYILWALEELAGKRDEIGGLVYNVEGGGNGHFTSTFKPVSVAEIPGLEIGVRRYFFDVPRPPFSSIYLPPNARK